MTPNDETERDRIEVELLVAQLLDGDHAARAQAGLDALLTDRKDLQRHYAALIATYTLLCEESAASLDGATQAPGRGEAAIAPVASVEVRRRPDGAQSRGKNMAWAVAVASLGLAASLAVAVRFNGPANPSGPGVPRPAPGRFDLREEGLLVRDQPTLQRLTRLYRTTSIDSLLLPHEPSGGAPEFTLCSGDAWLEFAARDLERGYLVTLPPHTAMDVWIGADAGWPNALNIVELSPSGELTGRSLSFSNQIDLADGPRPPGPIGRISEYNASASNRYYLFMGNFQSPDDAEEGYWRSCDYRVAIDTPSTLVIGWDDSGYQGDNPARRGAPGQDRDFNDLHAIIRMHPSRDQASASGAAARFVPARLEGVGLSSSPSAADGFSLHLREGEEAVLFVAGHGRLGSGLQVVDQKGHVVWRDADESGRFRARRRTDRAFYLVHNTEPLELRLRLQAIQLGATGPEASEPTALSFRVLAEDSERVLVGFEDGKDGTDDWKELRIEVYRLGGDALTRQ